jgi:hypothetical protein
MKPLLAASVLLFASVVAVPAIAQNEESGVPIMKAPYHLPVFTRGLRNIGTTRIEIEEFELK